MQPEFQAVIGVDGGGSKTVGALVASSGEILALTSGPPSNYQAIGAAAARDALNEVVAPLLETAARQDVQVGYAAMGLAGWDRPADAAEIEKFVGEVLPQPLQRTLLNDTFLILRAGSLVGFGIGVVSGTGSNCVGLGLAGERKNIGGLAYKFGDGGGGSDLGTDVLRAAFRGEDGRGARTILSTLLRENFRLQRLDDLVDFFLADSNPRLRTSDFCPFAFEAASRGDDVAIELLRGAGNELSFSVVILARQLFSRAQAFPIVLGGSVLQKGSTPHMRDALISAVQAEFPRAEPVTLDIPPLAGAVLLAFDGLASPTLDRAQLDIIIRSNFRSGSAVDELSSEYGNS